MKGAGGSAVAGPRRGGLARAVRRVPRRVLLAAVGAAGTLGAGVLFSYDPMRVGFYPRCPLYLLTGLYCPGCGALRAGHALLHGHVAEAVDFNVFLVVALPFLVYGLVRRLAPLAGFALPEVQLSGRAVRAVFAAVCVFTVLRNLPWAPFTALAP
jgi:hypothetical protein